jgi:outer membrane protein assembly factor BamB
MRISAQIHAQDGGNPMWGLDADYECADAPSRTLRAVFGSQPSDPADTAAPAAAPSTTETETPPSVTSAPPSNALGEVELTADTISNLCAPGSAAGSVNGQIAEIISGGIAVLNCNDHLAAVQVSTGAALWTRQLADTSTSPTDSSSSGPTTAESILTGRSSHVYLLATTAVPASGLAAGYITRTITALDARTGNRLWSQPLEADDRDDNTSTGTAVETPGPTDGATQVLVTLDGYSAFDADSGKPEWRAKQPDNNSTYVGYNLALGMDTSSAPENTTDLIATDLSTGKITWTDHLADGQTTVSSGSNYTGQLVGHTYWTFSDTGYDAFNVLTGQQTGHAVYPTAWTHTLATPQYIVAHVDTSLRLFHTATWAKPIWSIAAADTTPLAITDNAVLVQAASGNLVLSAADGSILANNVPVNGTPSQDQLVDGLLNFGNSILNLAGPR